MTDTIYRIYVPVKPYNAIVHVVACVIVIFAVISTINECLVY